MFDLQPRVLGVDDDGEADPETRDEDWYEASVTIGYGCETVECRFYQGNFGSLSQDEGGKTYSCQAGYEWAEVAEKHTADHCQDCWYEVNGEDQYLPDEPSEDFGECARCKQGAILYPTFGDPIAERSAAAITVETAWSQA